MKLTGKRRHNNPTDRAPHTTPHATLATSSIPPSHASSCALASSLLSSCGQWPELMKRSSAWGCRSFIFWACGGAAKARVTGSVQTA